MTAKLVKKKVKKKKLPTIAFLKRKAQTVFNNFVRTRDASSDGTFICISCGKKFPINKMQAGHWYGTKKYNHMRYMEQNCHSEDIGCNAFNHEALIGYTINIKNKIGEVAFNELIEISKHKPEKDFSRVELLSIIEHYSRYKKS